jgi:UDP-glucuronate decarboxylase
MRIIVAGGAGFLGSHLVDSLIVSGNHVTVLDNLSTGSLRNLKHLEKEPKFSFILEDVLNPIEIECDLIYNLACPASPVQYQKNPVNTIKTNLIGASNLLDLADKNKARIFQASTSEVYGDPNVTTQSEDYWGNVNPIGIRSCYDEGKRAAESLFFDFHRQFETEIKVARIFNTYGPRMDLDDGRVISNFIVQALSNLPITIYGDGSQTRSFCYVEDLIIGIEKFMDSEAGITGPINLGNPVSFSMLELAESILELTNSKSKIIFESLPQDDPKQRRPDITKAKSLLNWEPSIQLEEGLKRTIDEFKSRIKLKKA